MDKTINPYQILKPEEITSKEWTKWFNSIKCFTCKYEKTFCQVLLLCRLQVHPPAEPLSNAHDKQPGRWPAIHLLIYMPITKQVAHCRQNDSDSVTTGKTASTQAVINLNTFQFQLNLPQYTILRDFLKITRQPKEIALSPVRITFILLGAVR